MAAPMTIKRSLVRRVGAATKRMRAERLSMPEKNRRIRLYSAIFVAESENIEGAAMTKDDLLNGKTTKE